MLVVIVDEAVVAKAIVSVKLASCIDNSMGQSGIERFSDYLVAIPSLNHDKVRFIRRPRPSPTPHTHDSTRPSRLSSLQSASASALPLSSSTAVRLVRGEGALRFKDSSDILCLCLRSCSACTPSSSLPQLFPLSSFHKIGAASRHTWFLSSPRTIEEIFKGYSA
ncbi:hypothetical protein NL676_020372 [Syzygium grande]|nr:hypothetical protein NL676_020372 [Syzygium grande]